MPETKTSNVQLAGYFEPLAPLAGCGFCSSKRQRDESITDAVYCISLQEQDDRAQQAAAHFHAVGLCRSVIFYRPRRGRDIDAATWTSHRDVARHAVSQGYDKVLVLEDDVQFTRDWDRVSRRAARAMTSLPRGWWGFYLGHWPFQAYFIAHDVMRVRSACMHAYIANRPLLDWLAHSAPLDPTIPMLWVGQSIDAATANLPEMYALFPMAATQRATNSFRIDRHFTSTGSRRKFYEISRYHYWLIVHAMRAAEAIAVLLSPLHWISMRLRRVGSGQPGRIQTRISQQAHLIRNSALFDEAYYLSNGPDISASSVSPLGHYIKFGDREGRAPHPLFDPTYYHKAFPNLGREENAVVHYLQCDETLRKDPHPLFKGDWYMRDNRPALDSGMAPLSHFLQIGGFEGRSPHPCFDTKWYLAQYPDVAAMHTNPLVHYLTQGWKEGRSPHPAFATRRYLSEHADVAAAGINPLDHYVRHGRQEGRAPWFVWSNGAPGA